MRVLVACEFSGIVRDAFLAIGHDAWSCDLLDTDRPGPHFKSDVREVLAKDSGWDMMLAFPPCTYLVASNNANWKKTDYLLKHKEDRREAIEFFLLLAASEIPKTCVENPRGIMSTVFRKPDQYINPCYFGHKEMKKTALWLKGLPKLVPTTLIPCDRVPYRRWAAFKSSKEKSRFWPLVAEAMAEQWG